MRKKILSLGLAALIGTSSIIIPITQEKAYANADLEKKKADIQNERSGIDSNIQEKQGQLSELEQKEKSLNNEIERLDKQTADTNEKIRERQAEIEAAKQKIEELKVQIEEVKERIKKRNLLLEDRVRSLQESGGVVSYLDVLLGAQDFGDLVTRVSAVTTIVDADKEIIKAHEEDKKLLEQSEAELSSQLQKLETALTELESLKQQLAKQAKEKEGLIKQVKAQHQETEAAIYELEDEAAFLKEQEAAIQKEMERQKQLEEQRKREAAEAAARAKQEAEAAAAAKAAAKAAAAKKPAASSSNESAAPAPAPAPAPEPAPAPAVTGGKFMWPAQGTFTSGYGHRWGKLHAGIDIANRASNVPVVAAAAGTVIRSYYSSSYGNCVFISHNIDGKVYTTVYAHLDARHVSSGQSVSKGQQLGFMGNTGRSTGKHLHFEIHDGAWKNPVNPMQFLQ
ncbi:murein hydrolase activator EnvC family protein [Metabacillus idriensis]|uniref:murein hydrolase activator EnvC family protein n=1 Tax=Metabacillus idriensis TaxID=324768 RepID=UPI001749B40A|nr:peptidoglycan DD-metalloendopeptidase family protein [Metabacillus idriensis]